MEWSNYFAEAHAETAQRQPSFEYEEYYRSGRASKDWPNKEDDKWWAKNGPLFVKSWEQWRNRCGMKLWEFLDEETGELAPGIEVQTWAYGPKDIPLLSIVDRVFVDAAGDLRIVDLKSGSHTQPWPLQLILNNLGLQETFGVKAKWGGFWKARKGTIDPHWFDLSIYSDDWAWDMVAKAKEIRDRQLFIPNPNNLCNSACGVRQHCAAMGGTPFFPVDATLTQGR